MNVIHKYPLPLPGFNGWVEISMPVEARVIHVAMQNKQLCVWAIVGTDEEEGENRRFFVAATGQELPADLLHYYGTVHDSNMFVWHVFS